MKTSCALLVGLVLLAVGSTQQQQPEPHRVNLSNLTGLPSSYTGVLHAGYIPLTGSNKKLYYMMADSEKNFDNDPVLLWMNGGPGCSSMFGFFYEHGPVGFKQGQENLLTNRFSWNTNMTVVYLDAPAGTGFSTVGSEEDYKTDDASIANDNFIFLREFLHKYSQLRDNDIYIAGEGWAAQHIPLLAQIIQEFNKQQTESAKRIRLRSIILGNPFVDPTFDGWNAEKDAWMDLGLYTPDLRARLDVCKEDPRSDDCVKTKRRIADANQMLNLYSVYEECRGTLTDGITPGKLSNATSTSQRIREEARFCIDVNGINDYLSIEKNRQALHIQQGLNWRHCSKRVQEGYKKGEGSLYAIAALLRSDINITIYSGDSDAVAPTLGTSRWIRELQKRERLITRSPTRAWFSDGQVAGFVTRYSGGLNFITVRAAGHHVPMSKPRAALQILSNVVWRVALPTK